MKKIKYYIYKHTNLINGKCYIGETSKEPDKRWGKNGSHYCFTDTKFSRAIKKYGWENFSHEILEILDTDNLEEVGERESYYITLFDSFHNGYNSTSGGEVGKEMSEDSKKKMSVAHLGMRYGEETKKKLSEMRKGENCYWYGKHRSEETKKKISATLTGRTLSKKDRKHKSEAQKKRYESEKERKKTSFYSTCGQCIKLTPVDGSNPVYCPSKDATLIFLGLSKGGTGHKTIDNRVANQKPYHGYILSYCDKKEVIDSGYYD